MRVFAAALLALTVLSTGAGAQNQPTTTTETIAIIRHGEKPSAGLGQLTCQGLNRALALPDVLLKKFGTPDFIFAPNPTEKSEGGKYFYVRPLVTIEPTAIRCGMPIDTEFGYKDTAGIEGELAKPAYANATVFVAWEHGKADEIAKDIVKANGGDPDQVPEWKGSEYDMILVIKITRGNGPATVSFTVDHEGLNGQKDTCPAAG